MTAPVDELAARVDVLADRLGLVGDDVLDRALVRFAARVEVWLGVARRTGDGAARVRVLSEDLGVPVARLHRLALEEHVAPMERWLGIDDPVAAVAELEARRQVEHEERQAEAASSAPLDAELADHLARLEPGPPPATTSAPAETLLTALERDQVRREEADDSARGVPR